MKTWARVLLNADPGGSGGAAGGAAGGNAGSAGGGGSSSGTLLKPAEGGAPAPSWRDDIPAEFKADPSLATIKTVGDLAKGYVHAQKLIGVDKMAAPNDKWTDAEWSQFYDRAGRPKTADEYAVPQVKLPEGMKLDDKLWKETQGVFHGLGLSSKQAEGVMKRYLEVAAKDYETQQASKKQTEAEGRAALQQEWGRDFENKLKLAQAAIQKFGGDEVINLIAEAGLGNSPAFVKMLSVIGAAISDSKLDGRGGGLQLDESATAAQTIEQLKIDKTFMEALNSREHAGHDAAVKRWQTLHGLAFRGKTADVQG